MDSEEIKNKIYTILSSSRLPHAFLLTGPRGLGKTSLARIIAKSVNCLLKSKNGEPCGKCEMCTSITLGNNLDVLEMDAASNRGIDEIRDLREKIRLAPTKAKYKVYIIDEVHMLTNEAFNALLKTLEEPPEHAIFILCTTEKHKVPETIASRCVILEFKYPTISEIIRSLERVVKAEKIEMERNVFTLIAKAARGSFRDGQKILDQLSLSGKKITEELASSFLGGGTEQKEELFFKLLISKKTKETLEFIHNEESLGREWKLWLENILNILHEGLLSKSADINPQNKDFDFNIFKDLNISDFQLLISLFTKAYLDLKTSIIRELPLELAVVEWGDTNIKNQKSIHSTSSGLILSKVEVSNIKNEEPEDKNNIAINQNTKVKQLSKTEKPLINEDREEIKGKKTDDLQITESTKDLLALWPKILQTVRPINHSVEALLRSARPIGIENNCLVIEVFYKFHKERLEEPKIFEIMNNTISDLIKSVKKVKYVLGQKTIKPVVSQDETLIKAAEEIFGT